ncbi:MAG: NUDIX hydrolase [Candidatus Paceibacterota bacterium]|jgi:ADP-ribose pyrophosphatase YjhB (NUDIX family)
MTTKEKPKDFNTSMRVGGMILRVGDEVLLFKRAAHKKFGAGQWALCAGKMEEGENYEDGIIRECFEETGLFFFKRRFTKNKYILSFTRN